MTSAALHTAYTAWYDELLIFAFNRVKNEQDAQDIVQEAFVKLWQADVVAGQERPLLWTITKNATTDMLRHRKYLHGIMRPLLDEDWGLAKEDEDARRHQAEAMILARVAQAAQFLPIACRKVFDMYWRGKKTEQIMTSLRISWQNVLNQKTRAIQLLRKKLVKLL